MTRHRLILTIVAVVLCGVAWWLSLDRLCADEHLLVGTRTFDAGHRDRHARSAGLLPRSGSKSTSSIGLTIDAQSL